MRTKPLPGVDLLRAFLSYDAESGILIWKMRLPDHFENGNGKTSSHRCAVFNSVNGGKRAFTSVSKNGYNSGTIQNAYYYAHRVIWKMETGDDPDDVDHINGVRTDNRFSNLRSVTRSGNLKNRCLSTNNTSGCHGVSFSKTHKLWTAAIHHENVRVHLGWFRDKYSAISARKLAEVKYDYHSNHGRRAPRSTDLSYILQN